MIVVDTNLVARSVIAGEGTDAAFAVRRRDQTWVAPPLLWSELRNFLVKEIRWRGLRSDDAELIYSQASEMVDTLAFEPPIAEILVLCSQSAVSAYDAEFVHAARRLGVPLVTGDRRLQGQFPAVALSPEAFVAGDSVHEP